MDEDKAIRAAKLTLGAVMDKRRAKTAKDRAGGQIAPSKYLPNVPRQVHADGGEVTPDAPPPVDLGQVREQKQMQTFHTGMMGDIRDRMTQAMEAHQKAVDAGHFDGYEVGDVLQGKNSPLKITGRYVQKWKPSAMTLQHFDRMGAKPTIIEHEGQQYIPMLRYTSGSEAGGDNQEGSLYLDAVKATGMRKMGGLRAVKARGGQVSFQAGNHPDVPEVLYHGNAPKIAYKGWTSEIDQDRTAKNIEAQDFREFRPSEHGNYGPGIYLTDKPEVASDFAQGIRAGDTEPQPHGQVLKLHVSMKQPFTDETLRHPAWRDYIKRALTRYSLPHGEDLKARKAIFDALDNGTATVRDLFVRDDPRGTLVNQFGQHDIHDTIRNSGFDGIIAHRPDGSKEYVAFKPEQVKSALSAKTYDPTNPDMTFADGGRVLPKGYTIHVDKDRFGVLGRYNGKNVAQLTLNRNRDTGAVSAFQMAVHPKHQRKGLMSAMHDAAEDAFGPLQPDATLTDDGFAFWKGYRPDAVSNRLRFYQDNLMGKPVNTPYGMGRVKSVGDRGMTAELDGKDGATAYARASDNVDMLRASGVDPDKITYADGGYVPEKTQKAYKLFRTKGDGKLYPLFVHADKPVEMGKWLEAEEGPQGKTQGKVKSKLGDLAYRPGWHAGDLPIATHIGGKSDPSLKKPDYRPDNHVWAEVEMAADKDWQAEANSRGKGVKAHITDQVPAKGFYRYKTNPNMTGNWLIGGNMKVNRVLSDDEVKAINDAAGVADLPRLDRTAKADGGSIAERSPMFEGMSEHLLDDEGKPMELWHGTPGQPFEAFDDSKIGVRDPGFYGRGHYLTPIKGNAEGYADPDEMGTGTVMGPMHAALKNPYIWDASSENASHRTLRDLQSMGIMKGQGRLEPWDNLQRHHIDPFMEEMQKRGHDGVIVKMPDYQGDRPHRVTEVVVFKPSAVKHRDAEVGDPEDPRIMRNLGGRLYSRAAKIMRGMKDQPMQVEDIIKYATGKGARKAEIEHSDPPRGGMARPSQVAQHIEDMQPQIGVIKREQNYRYGSDNSYLAAIRNAERAGNHDLAEELNREWEAFAGIGLSSQPRYAKYQLPGGENYREHILTLDNHAGPTFTANQHWGRTPNPLAHIRMSDRIIGNRKILHIEELQSDWNSQARKRGISDGSEQRDLDNFIASMRQKAISGIDPTASDPVKLALQAKYQAMDPHMLAMKLGGNHPEQLTDYKYRAMPEYRGAPAAPYIHPDRDDWAELAIKHILMEAAKGGYDGIAFTPDEAQEERWKGTKFKNMYNSKFPNIAQKLVQQHDTDTDKDDMTRLDGWAVPMIPLSDKARDSINQNGFSSFRRGGYVTHVRRAR